MQINEEIVDQIRKYVKRNEEDDFGPQVEETKEGHSESSDQEIVEVQSISDEHSFATTTMDSLLQGLNAATSSSSSSSSSSSTSSEEEQKENSSDSDS